MILNISSMIDKQEENLLSQLKRCEDIFSIVNAQSEYIETNLSAFQGKHIQCQITIPNKYF